MHRTEVAKWGDMKPADLAKEQGEHKINKLTDVPGMWRHQDRMYGDCKGMSVVYKCSLECTGLLYKGNYITEPVLNDTLSDGDPRPHEE